MFTMQNYIDVVSNYDTALINFQSRQFFILWSSHVNNENMGYLKLLLTLDPCEETLINLCHYR